MSGETPGLLEQLAAKWDATAARNQRNGQSLVDQGDSYGEEGLAIAEALGNCVIELRAAVAAQQPQPAPEPLCACAHSAARHVAEGCMEPDCGCTLPFRYTGQPAPDLAAQLAQVRAIVFRSDTQQARIRDLVQLLTPGDPQ